MKTVFWFRRDLRLHDNAGLYHALKQGGEVMPVFIFDQNILSRLEDKNDKRVIFIHEAIAALKQQLQTFGSDLKVFYGHPADVFAKLFSEDQIKAVYTNTDYEPSAIARDESIRQLAKKAGISFNTFKDQCIFDYTEVLKDNGEPYTVYTPYSKKWKAKFSNFYCKAYPNEKYFSRFAKMDKTPLPTLESMGFIASSVDFPSKEISKDIIRKYAEQRDIPAIAGTSKLSVHFRFGTISIREKVRKSLQLSEKWLNELIWRDFYMQILGHFPRVVNQAFKPAYDKIEWRNNPEEFEHWCNGTTGFPIVDAGMRELNATGFMHNRVRMIVASFLTKDLLIDWRWGEAYFAQKLLDYELASNNGGWQWAAGSGVDAAPYFRVFNPRLQTEKFDPEFKYIRQWIPEYGTDAYPLPIVDHAFAKERCLKTYQIALKGLDIL
ncbi:MAG: deoxyribodipyrimidine photo-lyase [Bacteroidota bacterium]